MNTERIYNVLIFFLPGTSTSQFRTWEFKRMGGWCRFSVHCESPFFVPSRHSLLSSQQPSPPASLPPSTSLPFCPPTLAPLPLLPTHLSPLSHFNLKCFQFYSRVELTTPDVKLPTKSIIISLQKRIFQSLASAFEKWKI